MKYREKNLIELFRILINEKTEESESNFFGELYNTRLLVPVRVIGELNEKTNFPLLVTKDGKKFIPSFVESKVELGNFTKEQLQEISYVNLKFVVIDSCDAIDGIAINPYGENIILNKSLIELIDSKQMGMTISREKQMKNIDVYEAKNVSEQMIKKLCSFFENSIGVQSAWILFAKNESDVKGHLMVIIDFIGSKFELFPIVADIMKNYMKPGERFELIQKSNEVNIDKFDVAKIYSKASNSILS
ncbi:MAG: enhanced serine sensitivity protein SseB C-terminal domain-containing protein [Aminipila sp.]